MKEVRIAEKTALNTGLCEFSDSGHSLLCIARIYETPNKVLTLEDQNIIQTFKNEKKAPENNVNIKHKSYLIGFTAYMLTSSDGK